MKFKINTFDGLREMHCKYSQGWSDQEVKKWYSSVQLDQVNEEETCDLTDRHLKNLREDFGRAIKYKSLENAEKIQEWFKVQPHLPQPSLGLIHKFLWASKEDVELCKKKLTKFYLLRGTDDEIFGNRDPCSAEARQVYESSHFACLPGFTEDLYRVTISVLKDFHPNSFVPKEWTKRFFNLADLRVRDDFCLGDIIIFDFKGFTLNHLVKFPITLAKRMVVAGEGALPTRAKQIHYINCPPFIDKVVGLFKPFLKEKLAKRIYIHMDTLDELYKFIPRDMLPYEYGGKAGSIQDISDMWIKEMEKNRDWYLEEERNIKRIYMEAKRAGKLFNDCGELFGMEGSFKKLAID